MSRKLASGKLASQWVLFEKPFVIPDYDDPKEPSRIRWRLFHCPFFGIYLHKWFKPDPRSTPHNHPWAFISFILVGGYMERRVTGDRFITWVNVVRRDDFHNVSEVMVPTWSLMLVGRDRGDWGYLDPEYVPFEEHRHSAEFKAALEERNAIEG